MRKTVFTFGLLSGIIAALLMLINLYVVESSGNWDRGVTWGYTAIVLSLVFVFFGIRSYRENVMGGTISFGKAFYVGLLIALVSSILYVLCWLVVNHFLFPDFADRYADAQIQKLQDAGKSAQEIADMQAELMKYKDMAQNPLMNALLAFTEPFPVGVVITLISALILKRKSAATK